MFDTNEGLFSEEVVKRSIFCDERHRRLAIHGSPAMARGCGELWRYLLAAAVAGINELGSMVDMEAIANAVSAKDLNLFRTELSNAFQASQLNSINNMSILTNSSGEGVLRGYKFPDVFVVR